MSTETADNGKSTMFEGTAESARENQNKYRARECHKEKEKGTTAHSVASRNDGETHDPTSSSWHVQCTADEEGEVFSARSRPSPLSAPRPGKERKEKKNLISGTLVESGLGE